MLAIDVATKSKLRDVEGYDNHEEVVMCHDSDSGLEAIIAIHNTMRGPALVGALAGILALGKDERPRPSGSGAQVTLVAGARNQLYLLFTACGLIARQEPNRPPGLSVG